MKNRWTWNQSRERQTDVSELGICFINRKCIRVYTQAVNFQIISGQDKLNS